MGGRARRWAARVAQSVAAALMVALVLTFVLQIAIRHAGGAAAVLPFLDPARFGWTLELCLALWVWLVFWGGAFVVRPEDQVRFDLLHERVGPGLRRAFGVIAAVAVALALGSSVAPTWERLEILGLKRSATLGALFGDWIRMRDIHAIYIVFLVAVAARCGWQALRLLRGDAGRGGG